MTHFNKALHDPASVYARPSDVISDNSLTIKEQHAVLKEWEFNVLQLQHADEENMGELRGQEGPSLLSRIHCALEVLEERLNKP